MKPSSFNFILSTITLSLCLLSCYLSVHFFTEKEKLQQAKENLAYYKQLAITNEVSNLYNNTYFSSILDHHIDKNDTVTLISFSCGGYRNSLKSVNDTYGHLVGNLLIRAFSDTLKAVMHNTPNVILGSRGGGTNYALCTGRLDSQQLQSLAEDFKRRWHLSRVSLANNRYQLDSLALTIITATLPAGNIRLKDIEDYSEPLKNQIRQQGLYGLAHIQFDSLSEELPPPPHP